METFKDLLVFPGVAIFFFLFLLHWLRLFNKSESIVWTVVILLYGAITGLILMFGLGCVLSSQKADSWECVLDVYTDIGVAIQDVIDGNFIKPSFK